MKEQQLEISFDRSTPIRLVTRRNLRTTRAHWWFTQMRQVVEQAWEWEAARQVSPEEVHPPVAQVPSQ